MVHERAVSESAGGSLGGWRFAGSNRVAGESIAVLRMPALSPRTGERSLLALDQRDVPHAAAGQGPSEAEASHAAANDDDGALQGRLMGGRI